MRAAASLLIASLMLSSCGKPAQTGDTTAAGSGEEVVDELATRLPMKEFMGHVVQFTAAQVWKWQGSVTDMNGERDLRPKTEKDWEDAESAALSLAEVTNNLLLPGRVVDDPRWKESVAKVRDVAMREAAAAEKKDYDKYFEVGGELDGACESCHVNFAPGYVAPPVLKLPPPPVPAPKKG